MKPGTLIVLEGIDGSGKTTQLLRLDQALRARGFDVVPTAEPHESSWGRRIRNMARSGKRLPPEEELRWFLEQRREHVAEVIQPALSDGKVVISDRYYISSVAYQGARGLDPEQILRDSEAEFPVPDLVLILEVDVDRGLHRVGGRGDTHEPVFEREDFLTRVSQVFREIDRDYVQRIDARGGTDEVHGAILSAIDAAGVLSTD